MAGRNVKKVRDIPGRFAVRVGKPDMDHPPGWIWSKLSDIARLESGHTPSRKHPEYWDGEIPWIGIRDARAHHGGYIYDTQGHTNQLGLDNSAARLLPTKTVCLSRTASVGYTFLLGRPMATSQDFVNWICSEALDPEFLMWAFRAEGENLRRFGKGTTHTTIYFPEVKAFEVCVPPAAEQRRIVAKLDALFSRSRKAKAALEAIPPLLDRYRQSILAAACSGRLTEKWRQENPDVEPARSLVGDFIPTKRRRGRRVEAVASIPGRCALAVKHPELPVPRGWEWVRLTDVADLKTGHTPSRRKPEYWNGEIPWMKVTDAGRNHRGVITTTDNCVTQSGLDNSSSVLLPKGAVCLSRTGSVVGYVVKLGCDMATSQDFANWICTPALNADFLRYALMAEGDHLHKFGKGSTHTTIYFPEIEQFHIALPPRREQDHIVQKVGRLLTAIDSLFAALIPMQEEVGCLERSILAAAFQGRLVPQDPNDEPASVLLERIRAERAAAAPKKKARRKRKTAS